MSSKVLAGLQKWIANPHIEVRTALPSFVPHITDSDPRTREDAYGIAMRFLRKGCNVAELNLDTERFIHDVFGAAGAGVQQSALRLLCSLDGWNAALISPNFDTIQFDDFADENFGSVIYSFGTLLLRSWIYLGGEVAIDSLRTLLLKAVQIPHLIGHALLVVEEFLVDFLGIESSKIPLYLLENEVGVPRIVKGDAYLSLPLYTVLPLMLPHARTSDAPSAWTPWGRWAVFELLMPKNETRPVGVETNVLDIGNTARTLHISMLQGALRLRNCKNKRESKALWNTLLELIGEDLLKTGSKLALHGAALSPRCIYRVMQKEKSIVPKLATGVEIGDYGMEIRNIPSVACQGLILRQFAASDVWPHAWRWNTVPQWSVSDKCLHHGKETTIKSIHPMLTVTGDVEVHNVADLRLDRGHLTPEAELAFLLCLSLWDRRASTEITELPGELTPFAAKAFRGETVCPSRRTVMLNHELRTIPDPEHEIIISASPPLMTALSYRRRERTTIFFLSISNCADDTLEVKITLNLQRWKLVSEPPEAIFSNVTIGGRSTKRIFLGDAVPGPLSEQESKTSMVCSELAIRPLLLFKLSYNLEDSWDENVEDDRITHTMLVEISSQIYFTPFQGFRDIPWSPELFETRIERLKTPLFGTRFQTPDAAYRVGIYKDHLIAENIEDGHVVGQKEVLAQCCV
eukprot:GEMP01023576.1.p1 GENE.GEMP01023576.1~~GEMP01023576.1.p1  ORF type:complete len:689 (+),score=155.31 GEMP01023576.1:280-2346(+)